MKVKWMIPIENLQFNQIMICGTCILTVHLPKMSTGMVFHCTILLEKTHSFSYRLNFSCTNNVAEIEALLLVLENALELGCQNITIFGDSELIINFVRKVYNPSNKLMRQYTTLLGDLIAKFTSFDISHVKNNLNVVSVNLALYASRPEGIVGLKNLIVL